MLHQVSVSSLLLDFSGHLQTHKTSHGSPKSAAIECLWESHEQEEDVMVYLGEFSS